MPGHWGLTGKTRQVAQAEYELEGYELEVELEVINLANLPEEQIKANMLMIEKKYNKISERDYDFCIAELRNDPMTLLQVKRKHKEIDLDEFDKECATLAGEPWVNVDKVIFSDKEPGAGSLELDWNDLFVEMIQEAGYTAPTAEGSVDLWLTDLCRNIALEELQGTGVFDEESDESLKLKRKRLDDGTVEVS